MKKKINKKNSKNLWSGRFEESPSETMLRINSSISFDKTLYEQDISASKVHATMLSNQSIITKEELKKRSIKQKIGLLKRFPNLPDDIIKSSWSVEGPHLIPIGFLMPLQNSTCALFSNLVLSPIQTK